MTDTFCLYRFKQILDSKTRLDCIASTRNYRPFEALRNRAGRLVIKVINGKRIKKRPNKIPPFAIEHNGTNTEWITSVYIKDKTILRGFGDFYGTNDAIIAVWKNCKTEDFENEDIPKGAILDIYIFGSFSNSPFIHDMFIAGKLNNIIEDCNKKLLEEKINK